MGGKKLNEYDLVDAGLSLLGKKIKKEFHQLQVPINNKIKDIEKVIKELLAKLLVKEDDL